MSIKCDDLRLCIVRPTLALLDLTSFVRENLLLGTAAQESHMGSFLLQVRGPAKGIYQMEPATHDDIWANYLKYRPELSTKVEALMSSVLSDVTELEGNLYYATAMATIRYLRAPMPLPVNSDDILALASYWKKNYNTVKGKGTVTEFVMNYKRFVAEKNL